MLPSVPMWMQLVVCLRSLQPEGFIKFSRIILCQYSWIACRLYFVAIFLYFLFNSQFPFVLLFAYCLAYFLLSLIAFFHLDVMYGTSSFPNLIVFSGHMFLRWCQKEFSNNGIYLPVCQRCLWYSTDYRLDPHLIYQYV